MEETSSQKTRQPSLPLSLRTSITLRHRLPRSDQTRALTSPKQPPFTQRHETRPL
ncbi:hypothetical protein CCACVL1_19464 [Corchorus capsularis]|uniref:Uncharacterized protein n=1 Tax=Corchorus capsularis TaxID=210143 RepID=A0A1R3HGW1_COCAP|nr:hypothetical protein CCACVL1_19464 [Corchorus capsularis]